MTSPQPGDFAVVSAGGLAGPLVGWAERTLLGAGKYGDYEHAFIYIGDWRDPIHGHHEVVQAEPGGAAAAPLTPHAKTLWSTGKIPMTALQRQAIIGAACKYARAHTPYSILDYLAIGLHHAHIPIPHLRRYIASTGHMICSQLVDQCYQDAGVHLFDDGRDPGDVTPADLARLLTEAP